MSDPTPAAGIAPRLTDLHGAATYLGGISYWTVRDLIAAGEIPTVRAPAPLGRKALRRILIDLRDLDALIDKWKTTRAAPMFQSAAAIRIAARR